MYKVIKYFTDLQDNRYAYNVGDIFPREGLSVTPERLTELSSNKNRQGKPLIQEIKETVVKPAPIDEAVGEIVEKKTKKKKVADDAD